jgi:ElaA protein
MTWNLKKFEELNNDEVYRILQARVSIFVIEQRCFYTEIDGNDQAAYHLFKDDGSEIVAYLRIFPSGTLYPQASFGRVLVQKEYRNRGLARELINQAIHFCQADLQESTVKIQAQAYLHDFYASFGFRSISDIYLEDGIPHIDMLLR